MSRSTIRVLVSLVISLVIVAAVFASVQAASQSKPAALGVSISNHTFKAKPFKQEAYRSYSHGDWDCGHGWMVDPDD